MTDFYIIKKNKYIFTILSLICFLLYIVLFLISSQEQKYSDIEETIADNGKDYQFTGELISDIDYNNYLQEDNIELFDRLNNFKRYQENELGQKYIAISPQTIEIADMSLPPMCSYGYEEGISDFSATDNLSHSIFIAKSISVSASFFDNFSIAPTYTFSEHDYNYREGDNIPVLLGSDYISWLNVGDTFKGYYLCEEFTFQVKGFIEKESFFVSPETQQFESCSRYIVLPSFNFDEVTKFSKIHLLQQMVGVVYSDLSYEQLSNIYLNNLTKAGIPSWNIFVSNKEGHELSPVELYKGMSNEIKRNFQLLLIMLLVFYIIMITIILCAIFKKYHMYFGIKRLCGAKRTKIFLEICSISAIPILTGISMAFFIILPFVSVVISHVIFLFASAFGVIFLVTFICSEYLFKFDLKDIIGGKE